MSRTKRKGEFASPRTCPGVNGRWLIGDTGSKNGTFVDGARVANGALVPLRDGGSLRFGDVTAKFWLPTSFCLDLRKRMKASVL